jgi:hypothetical protein
MTIGEIAARMSCSKSTVISINRRFRVREYNGYDYMRGEGRNV